MFRRLFAAILLLIVAGALSIALWPQLFELQRTAFVAQTVSLRGAATGVAVIGIGALGLVALLSRSFRRLGASLALLLLVFGLASTAVLATRGFGNPSFETRGPAGLTVVSWNTLGGATGSAAIAKLALESDADILTLPETNRATGLEVANLMKAAGRPMFLHTVAFDQISKARSTSVLTSVDLGGYHVDAKTGSTTTLPSVVLEPDNGQGPRIVAAHPVSPVPAELRNWNADLAWLSSACDAPNVIMAGDFNSTLDHLTGLGVDSKHSLGRCTDAAALTRNAAVGTWPTTLPALLGAPIDHVMVTDGWRVTGMKVVQNLDNAGSDHRPIVVQLQPRS